MEWLKNKYRGWHDYFFPKPQPVAWNEVIQLDPFLDKTPAYKAQVIKQLVRWEKTESGQETLTALKDAQSRIPKDHHWRKGDYNVPGYDETKYHQDLGQIVARHTESKKLFLYIAAAKEEKFSTYDRYTNGGDYKEAQHILSLNPVKLEWETLRVPKIIAGKKKLANDSFIEVLQHEAQHAVDQLNVTFGKNAQVDKPRYEECLEVRAVGAQQKLEAELKLPRRYAYADPTLELQQTLVKGVASTPEGYAQLRENLFDTARYDTVGCSRENFSYQTYKSNADVNAVVDAAIKNHGVHVIGIPQRTPRERK